ncbi:nucleoside triphosphate pyrophosphatase [Phaeovulum sp.]|uniref:Maf family protein n=1 Tax=Phaeovulum sp. TaxID=2934796 RepID=UPI00356B5537
MQNPLILASTSTIRAELLRRAGLPHEIVPARVDEAAIRAALEAEGATPRDLADALAEAKARRVSERFPEPLVLGADQVLDLGGKVLSKPASPADAVAQLTALCGRSHRLLSALVVYQGGSPLWRHVGQVRLTMHPLSNAQIERYVAEHWDSIRHAVGCYKLEEHGVQLFSAVEGDYFTVLGLPLIEFLTWLRARGELA